VVWFRLSGRVIFHELLTVEEALSKIFSAVDVRPLGVEVVGLSEAYGRVLAEDIYSPIDVPPFDRSIVDGFAVRAEDLFGVDELNPGELRIVGLVEPGDSILPRVNPGEAVEISTGAPVPPGANSIVMIEYTRRVGDRVQVFRSVVPGENIAYAGSDIMLGELILRRCTRLGVRELGVLAATGLKDVRVYRRPRVAVISTGNELEEPGSPLTPGRIYDVNSYTISAALLELGAEPVALGVVGDDEVEMEEVIGRAEREYDMVVVSGGTSAGLGDLVYRVFSKLGPPGIIVHGLKVKPGKPTVVAVSRSGKLLVGLPGFPSSAMMIFNLIVKPILARMLCLQYPEVTVKARLAVRVEGARGRRGLYPVSLVDVGGGVVAYPLPAESGAIKVIAMADGFIEVPESLEYMGEGEEVTVKLFSHHYRPADLYVIGSHDMGLDRLTPLLGLNVKIINVGSLEGLKSVIRGEADIAGIHLVDEETGEYNIPYLKRYNVRNAVLIRGYMREQGLIVAKGNPNNVRGLEDVVDKGLTIVNRNRGSGTRVLLDMKLREIARARGLTFEELVSKVKGYYYEARTHTAVAAAISQGKADVGVGIKVAAELYNLDFISLGWEHYDFLIPKAKLGKEQVKAFISVLKSPEARRELEKLGYRVPSNVGEVVWEG
jgi:putative molybdopterin biosynthesis protein